MANAFNRFVNTSAIVSAAPVEAGSAPSPSVTVTPYDGKAAMERAKELAHKMGDDAAKQISGLMKAKEESVRGTIALMLSLQETYEDINEFPRPGVDTGNNRDVFDVEVTEGGKTTTKEVSFYVIFADATDQGIAINAEMDEIKRAQNTNANQTGIREEIAGLNPQELQARLNVLNTRRNTLRAAIKKAMQLHFQFIDVNELKYVLARPLWENEEKAIVQATAKPIVVFQPSTDGSPPNKWTMLGIGQFLKLKPKVAAEKGETFDALIATGKSGTDGGGETDTPAIKTVDTAIGRIVELHRWADEITGQGSDKADYGKLLKVVNVKDADELVMSIVELSNFLNDIRLTAKLDDKYVKIQQKMGEPKRDAA